MELHEFEILVDRTRKLHPNEELTAEFIWNYILCDYDMELKSSENVKNIVNKKY